jgi:predicted transcriptional regulator
LLDQVDTDVMKAIADYGPLTLSELSRTLGWSKSMVLKRVRKLESLGLIRVRDEGGVIIISPGGSRAEAPAVIGIVRASEYPYIMRLVKRLSDRYGSVTVKVYDDALQEAMDLAAGRIQLAMAPAITLITLNRLTAGSVHIVGGGSQGGAGIVTGRGELGHATSRMSSMELCAEVNRLEPPRVYANGGDSILNMVLRGQVREAVIWEPYLSIAERRGLKVEHCDLETCCLLGANSSLEGEYDRIAKAMEEAVSEVREADLQAYANLVGMPYELVSESIKSYSFLERPDREVLRRLLPYMRSVALLSSAVNEAVRA